MNSARVKVVSIHFNRSDLIEPQVRSIGRFVAEPCDVSIFVDQPRKRDRRLLEWNPTRRCLSICRELGVPAEVIPREVHVPGSPLFVASRLDDPANAELPSYRTFSALQYVVDKHLRTWLGAFDYVLLLDSDMFLTGRFSLDEFSRDSLLCGVPQSRGEVEYLWNGLLIINCHRVDENLCDLLRFDYGVVEGQACDTGAGTTELMRLYGSEIRRIRHTVSPGAWDPAVLTETGASALARRILLEDFAIVGGIAELFEGVFLHYRAGGNWDRRSRRIHRRRSRNLWSSLLEEIEVAGVASVATLRRCRLLTAALALR